MGMDINRFDIMIIRARELGVDLPKPMQLGEGYTYVIDLDSIPDDMSIEEFLRYIDPEFKEGTLEI